MEKLVKVTAKDTEVFPQQNGGEETEGGEGKVDQGAISITFGRFNPPTVGHEKASIKSSKRGKIQWRRV